MTATLQVQVARNHMLFSENVLVLLALASKMLPVVPADMQDACMNEYMNTAALYIQLLAASIDFKLGLLCSFVDET